MKEQRQIPLQVRLASVGTIDTDKRTVELVWTTGARVRRFDWWNGEEFNEELSLDPSHVRMERLNAGAPLLNTHGRYDLGDVIGVVDKAWLGQGEGRAVVRFSRREDVEPIWRDVQDGIIRNVSVGYQVHRYEDVTEKGEKPKRMMATDWEPCEISLVPIGADAKAGVRAEAQTNACEIEVRDVPQGQTAGQAAPPAQSGGVGLDLFRRELELAEAEIH